MATWNTGDRDDLPYFRCAWSSRSLSARSWTLSCLCVPVLRRFLRLFKPPFRDPEIYHFETKNLASRLCLSGEDLRLHRGIRSPEGCENGVSGQVRHGNGVTFAIAHLEKMDYLTVEYEQDCQSYRPHRSCRHGQFLLQFLCHACRLLLRKRRCLLRH